MKRKRNVAIAIVLSAAAGFLALHATRVSAPARIETTQTPGVETIVTETPIAEASVPEQCVYTWAYQDAPELTAKLDAEVKAINPASSGRAQLFGEDCGYADGHSTFGAMETDFYVRSPVDDLTDEETLGNWVAQVMPIVSKIPREEIQGNYGFVEFSNTGGQVFIRVPIQKYMVEAQGKTGAELFRMFSNAQ
jgi:hypothetical protein